MYISKVRKTAFSKLIQLWIHLSKPVNTCYLTIRKTRLVRFYALYFCQTSNRSTTKSSTSKHEVPEIWEHISQQWATFVSTAIGKLFSTIKLVMITYALEVLKVNGSFCGTKLRVGCCRSDEALSFCILVNNCRFISASLWWAQLNSREQATHKRFV